ncbi:MAG TPA: hypothetical protein VFO27_09625, partial [Bryobacteraceae bacterium]|nr:hypothetical protein [Bryobacteraceae bacterium]
MKADVQAHKTSTRKALSAIDHARNIVSELGISTPEGEETVALIARYLDAFLIRKAGRKELTGRRFGRLLVLRFSRFGTATLGSKNRRTYWLCQCDCGKEKEVRGDALTEKRTFSCGCFGRELTSAMLTKHGLSSTPEYNSWTSMWGRCTQPGWRNF